MNTLDSFLRCHTFTGTLIRSEVVPIGEGVACVFDLATEAGTQTCTLTHDAWNFFTGTAQGDALTVTGSIMKITDTDHHDTVNLIAVRTVDEAPDDFTGGLI